MTRKDFIKNGAAGILGVVAGLYQSRCSSSMSPSDPMAQKTFESDSVNAAGGSHSHSITLTKMEMQSPPGGGISRATTAASGYVTSHSHTFAMTHDQMQNIMSGRAESITTSTELSHSHVFTITKWF
jgi:hypothetical protein